MNAPVAMTTPAVGFTITTALLRDPNECTRIEQYVARMGGSIFHRPKWLCAVERATGHHATGLIAETNGDITGWLPLNEVHSPVFGRALVSSGFAVEGGPLADSPAAARALCRAAEEMAVRRSFANIELRGGHAPADWTLRTDTHCSFVEPLADDDDAQLLAIPRKSRAEVRKSLKNDLTVTIGTSDADRAMHYATYAQSVRNLGTPVFPRALFDCMLDTFGDAADILTVSHRGQPVSSVLSFYHDGAVMPYWGGGTMAARTLRANERMYYELMLHARGKACDRFDFGRSKTGSGPYHFKKNWGFTPKPLGYAEWTADGGAARDVDPTSDAYARKIALWKRLPLPIANRLGPIISAGLA